jgi:hypothetical protein
MAYGRILVCEATAKRAFSLRCCTHTLHVKCSTIPKSHKCQSWIADKTKADESTLVRVAGEISPVAVLSAIACYQQLLRLCVFFASLVRDGRFGIRAATALRHEVHQRNVANQALSLLIRPRTHD